MANFPTQIKSRRYDYESVVNVMRVEIGGLVAFSFKHADNTGNEWDPFRLVGPTSHTLGASMGPSFGV